MSLRIIEVVAPQGYADTLQAVAEQFGVLDYWQTEETDGARVNARLLVARESQQPLVDALGYAFDEDAEWRIILLPVEATLPEPEAKQTEKRRRPGSSLTREELYAEIGRSARIDNDFLLLVVLSTVVAAIGLMKDNVAVVIGAMVIAPLLGPNLAYAFAAALGDRGLMLRAAGTGLAGLAIAVAISLALGMILPPDLTSEELMSRTEIGFDGVALALASGAAAALCITGGLSATLVGVMVAVALLPPAATIGIMLGAGEPALAGGAALLLAANVVSVNLAAQLLFLGRGLRPRTWLEKQKAKQSLTVSLLSCLALLAGLMFIIYLRSTLTP